jgi:hypothetical protein
LADVFGNDSYYLSHRCRAKNSVDSRRGRFLLGIWIKRGHVGAAVVFEGLLCDSLDIYEEVLLLPLLLPGFPGGRLLLEALI